MVSPISMKGGCFDDLAAPPRTLDEALPAPVPMAGGTAGVDTTNWLPWVLPSDHQHSDTTCVVRSFAGLREALARRAGIKIPAGYQIGVKAAYKWVVDKHYNGRDPGGMLTTEGFEAMLALGIFPAGSRMVPCRGLEAERRGMMISPLIQGHMTTQAWMAPSKTGYIDPSRDVPHFLSSHCTLRIGMPVGAGGNYHHFVDHQGPNRGWHGTLIMHRTSDVMTRHRAGPWYVEMPRGSDGHREWERYLVNKPEGD